MKVTERAEGIFEVTSESNAQLTYLANVGTEIPTCTCTAYAIKRNKVKKATGAMDGGWCKHLDAARSEETRLKIERDREEDERVEMEMARIRLLHTVEGLD